MNPVTALSLGRIVLGASLVARPDIAERGLGLQAPQMSYLTRLAGARDIALGVATLLAPRGARKALVGVGMAVDGGDAYAGYEAFSRGAVSPTTAAVLTAPAVGAVLLGAAGLLEKSAAQDL